MVDKIKTIENGDNGMGKKGIRRTMLHIAVGV
jgi:hypothetical protein